MRGFLDHRRVKYRLADSAASPAEIADMQRKWGAPLDDLELCAAEKQGCAGCRWWVRRPSENTQWGDCHHVASKVGTVDSDYWCSEWSGEPETEGDNDGNP